MAFPIELRVMKSEDVPEVMEMIQENDLGYASPLVLKYLELDPEALNVVVTSSGRVIGICGCIQANENLYVLRFHCVHEDYRSQGLGNKLVSWCLNRAGDENLGMSCDVKTQGYYLKRGFGIIGREWTFREFIMNHSLDLEDCLPKGVELHPLQDHLLREVLDYALAVVGCEDRTLLQDSCRTLVALQDGVCVGFGSISLNTAGASMVEPIYADNLLIAEGIFKRLIKDIPTGNIFSIGVLSDNRGMEDILGKFEVKRSEDDARIYTKESLKEDASKVFATSLSI